MNRYLPIGLAGLAALSLAACAGNPEKDPALERARAALQNAESDPAAVQFARVDIDQSRQLLRQAEESSERGRDELTEHQAYLAERSAQVAIERGGQQLAEKRVADADVERQRIQIAAREAEARHARERLQQTEQQLASARQENRELAAELAHIENLQGEVQQTARGLVLTLGSNVLFEVDKAQLRSGADRSLEQLAQFLRNNEDRRITIEGFTDATGPDEYNQALSERRAEAVRDALAGRGIESARISTRGYGEKYPVAGNGTPGERQLNRRVEVVISNDDRPVPDREALASAAR